MQLKSRMNQQEFERVFYNLTENRKNVLQKILMGINGMVVIGLNLTEQNLLMKKLKKK
jgi:hypothetical protein